MLLTDSDGYLFRHALIREAMHDELLPGERGQVHRRFAEVIGADPGLVLPGRAAVEQARHWHAAHDTTWALVSAWQAAGQAGRALAYAEQLAMLSRVLELWDEVPDAAQRIGADHGAVLEGAVGAELAGELTAGSVGHGRAAGDRCRRRTGSGRAPAGDPRPPEVSARPGDYADDLREAVRWSRPTRRARPGPGCSKRWPTHQHMPGGWDGPEVRAAAEEAVVGPAGSATPPPRRPR